MIGASTFLGKPLPVLNVTERTRLRSRAPLISNAFGKRAPARKATNTVVPEPSYSLPLGLAGITVLSAIGGARAPAAISALLGIFLAVQASRVKFRFESDALEVVLGDQGEKSENKFVGGENRWKYSAFTNWEYWWPSFPVLVYFKETQTKPEGQIHFFPILFNGKQLYDVMVERCGASQNSGPN